MSPIGTSLRERIRNFPSLVNCCTIDWFTKWPDEALEAVADRFLQDEYDDSKDIEIKKRLIKMCQQIHNDMVDLSNKYKQE